MNRIWLFWAFLSLLFVFESCKEKTLLDAGTLPVVDGINVFSSDTFAILSSNVYSDSINTSFLYSIGLGHCQDFPYLGPVSMSAILQFGLPTDQFTFGDSAVVDSVFLVLPYGGAYLDSTKDQAKLKLYVYEQTGNLKIDSTYYNYSDAATHSTVLLNKDQNMTYDFKSFKDSVSIWGVKRSPQIRIQLNQSIIDLLSQQTSTGYFSKTDSFLHLFKGLYIIPQVGAGLNGFAYFSSSLCGLEVNYHNSKNDSMVARFPSYASKCVHYTKVNRMYSPDIMNSVSNPNPNGEEWNYISVKPGVVTNVKIPYNPSLDKNVINDAVIVIKSPIPLDQHFPTLSRIFLRRLYPQYGDSLRVTRDYAFGSGNASGNYILGNREEVVMENGEKIYQYKYRITRELSDAMLNKEDLFFQISSFDLTSSIGIYYLNYSSLSTKIGGSNNPVDLYKMKLNIIYSKI